MGWRDVDDSEWDEVDAESSHQTDKVSFHSVKIYIISVNFPNQCVVTYLTQFSVGGTID